MKRIASFVVFVTFALPFAVSADQISDLQAQVQILTQVLAQLQQQKAAGQTAAAPAVCAGIGQTMGPGSTGDSVTALQKFLASDASVYPEAIVSGYYGALTTAAVQRFQVKYDIVSSGTPSTTGYGRVGPKTLAAIQARCAGSGAVSGFIQVSPVSGPPPLQVTVQATVNTTNDCGASVYAIDFSDGSQQQVINVAPGTCKSAQQTYTHTYGTSGSYAVTLSSGAHNSTATVIVQ